MDPKKSRSAPSWRSRVTTLLANQAKKAAKQVLPKSAYVKVRNELMGENGRPGLDWEHFCSLRRVEPIRRDCGWQSGQPVDRYYTETIFLSHYANDIRGHVLEIGDNRYTQLFGGQRVLQSDVLHLKPGNPKATIVADLTHADQIPSEAFDCIILTFTLQFVYDVRAAIRTLHRILKPKGVLLATFHGISQIARYDMEMWGEYWRFTTLSTKKLLTEVFPEECISVQAYGNVLTALASLHGIHSTELRRDELDYHDRDYEVVVTARVLKPVFHRDD
jgi:SAM-dependent methyltransferase